MWALSNQTRYAAERTFCRDHDGAERWLVAVRATFNFSEAGVVTPAKEQPPIVRAPHFAGDPLSSSLIAESDLVRTKSSTDVVVRATALAPFGEPVESLDVGIAVGRLEKHLIVCGDSHWEPGVWGIRPSKSVPFSKMPISYERAFGGLRPPKSPREAVSSDPRNPIGCGAIVEEKKPLPNIFYPGERLTRPAQVVRCAGFGAIPPVWQPRLKYAGTYDEAWRNNRRPLFPVDFDDRFFQCAPEDQQISGFLKGGEAVTLYHLTPSGNVRFQLPRIDFGFRTRISGGVTHHRADLHTILIEPDEMRFSMTWLTSLACHRTLYTLKDTTIFEKRRVGLDGKEVRSEKGGESS